MKQKTTFKIFGNILVSAIGSWMADILVLAAKKPYRSTSNAE